MAAAGHRAGWRGAARAGLLADLPARQRSAGDGPLPEPRAAARHAAGPDAAGRGALVGMARSGAGHRQALCRAGRADAAGCAVVPGAAAGRAAHRGRLPRARHARTAWRADADPVAGGAGHCRHHRTHRLPVCPPGPPPVGRGAARNRAGRAGLARALRFALARCRPPGQHRHAMARAVCPAAGIAAGGRGGGRAGPAVVRAVVVAGAVGALGRARAGRLAGVRQRLYRPGAGHADRGEPGAGAGGGALRGLPEPVDAAAVLRGAAHARVPGRIQRGALRGSRPECRPRRQPARPLQRGRARARRPAQPEHLLRSARAGAAAPDQRHAESHRRPGRATGAARPQGQAAVPGARPLRGAVRRGGGDPAGRLRALYHRRPGLLPRRFMAVVGQTGRIAHGGRLDGDLGRGRLHQAGARDHAGHIHAAWPGEPAAGHMVAVVSGQPRARRRAPGPRQAPSGTRHASVAGRGHRAVPHAVLPGLRTERALPRHAARLAVPVRWRAFRQHRRVRAAAPGPRCLADRAV